MTVGVGGITVNVPYDSAKFSSVKYNGVCYSLSASITNENSNFPYISTVYSACSECIVSPLTTPCVTPSVTRTQTLTPTVTNTQTPNQTELFNPFTTPTPTPSQDIVYIRAVVNILDSDGGNGGGDDKGNDFWPFVEPKSWASVPQGTIGGDVFLKDGWYLEVSYIWGPDTNPDHLILNHKI